MCCARSQCLSSIFNNYFYLTLSIQLWFSLYFSLLMAFERALPYPHEFLQTLLGAQPPSLYKNGALRCCLDKDRHTMALEKPFLTSYLNLRQIFFGKHAADTYLLP